MQHEYQNPLPSQWFGQIPGQPWLLQWRMKSAISSGPKKKGRKVPGRWNDHIMADYSKETNSKKYRKRNFVQVQ